MVELTQHSTPHTVPRDKTIEVPDRIPWSLLGPSFIRQWGYPRGKRQPEHIEILGQTGSGKSYFEKTILMQRAHVRGSHIVVIATKPADDTLMSTGWPVITNWPPGYRDKQVIFWAKSRGISREGREQQKERILHLLNCLWVPNSNIVVSFDEVAYIEKDLGLSVEVSKYYREARALGITIVSSTQRPVGVSRYMHSESGWTVCFAPKDDQDAERMAEVLGSKRLYKPLLDQLNREKYEFLIVRNMTREMYISWIDKRETSLPANKSAGTVRAVER